MVKLAFLDHRDKWIKTGCKCFGCERLRAKKDPEVVSVKGFVASKQRKQVTGDYRPKKEMIKKLIVKPKGESASGNTSLMADSERPCYKRHLNRKVDNLRGLPLMKPRRQVEVWDNGEVIHRPGAGRGKLLPFLIRLSLGTDASDDSSVDVSDNFSHNFDGSITDDTSDQASDNASEHAGALEDLNMDTSVQKDGQQKVIILNNGELIYRPGAGKGQIWYAVDTENASDNPSMPQDSKVDNSAQEDHQQKEVILNNGELIYRPGAGKNKLPFYQSWFGKGTDSASNITGIRKWTKARVPFLWHDFRGQDKLERLRSTQKKSIKRRPSIGVPVKADSVHDSESRQPLPKTLRRTNRSSQVSAINNNNVDKVSSPLPKVLHSDTSPESLGADRPVVKLDYWSVKFREINILYRVGEGLMSPALITNSGLRISYRNDMRKLKKGALADRDETCLQALSAYCGLLENFPIMTAEQAEVYHHPSTVALEFLDNKIPRTPLGRHVWKSEANKAFDDWAACYDNKCFSFDFKGYVEVLRREALLRASNGKDSVVSRNSHGEPSFAHRFLVSTKMRGPDEHPPLDTATIIKSKDSTSHDVQKTQG